jgi:hypothetical protein
VNSMERSQLPRGFWRTATTDKGLPLTTEYGLRDYTKVSKFMGLGGNRKEPSWNKAAAEHTCCGSRVSYRHKINCQDRQ